MNTSITRLDTWLRQQRPAYYAKFQPGASETELAGLEAHIGQSLPEAFKDLLRWRNGQSRDCYESLHDNQMLMPIAQIQETWTVMQELLEGGDFTRSNWWSLAWVPFLANGGGDHLCLDLGGSFTGQPGQLLQFWHDDPRRHVAFPDFVTYLETLAGSMEQSNWDEDEIYWEIDPDLAPEHLKQALAGYPKIFRAG